MLSSIHPLGERARHNRWWLTTASFTSGALASGLGVGLILGAVGSILLPLDQPAALVTTAGVVLVAGLLDLVGVEPPGPARQVNENWIGAYRGWVYGAGFGLELGLGLLTYVVTWGIYAFFAVALLTTDPLQGAMVGAVFGLGRSITLWMAVGVDRPSRLTDFNRRLARAGPVVRKTAALAFAGLGVLAMIGPVL